MNGCSGDIEVTFTKGHVTCEGYKGCPANAPVELCTIQGGGHRWAGAGDAGPGTCKKNPEKKVCRKYAAAVGPGNDDINAGEMMWNFFKKIRL